ncbi:hypothetical protein Lalb_Chr15g0081731 [Lupinus albus]|uniref:Uncharacterized protein n=1 Tax=Lupinus albus TaxID=3870 RepID=A0A6A4PDJ2_LUPAL|nr:hypothetical protein Lalb_Chr15g0081731 [Lupinus albus]
MNVMITALKKCHTLLQIVDKEDVSEELICVAVQVFKEQVMHKVSDVDAQRVLNA